MFEGLTIDFTVPSCSMYAEWEHAKIRIDSNDMEITRRIVACINACKEIPTSALESGIIRHLIEAHGHRRRAEYLVERWSQIVHDLAVR